MADINDSVTQNLLPVQAYFNLDGSFNTFIGQGKPFYATTNPVQSGLTITSSTIDSTTIGATTPSTGIFTNIQTTTGQITTAPSGGTDITNKTYVDNFVQGLNAKAAVIVATTANITLSGLQTIDGYTTIAGDRVLVKNQSLSQYNGIYIASASAWSRSPDMDTWAEVPSAYMFVMQGTTQQDTSWLCTSDPGGTLNVTPITFVQFGSAGAYTAGTGLTLSGNQFSITNTGVTATTYGSASAVPVIAVNAQGQITSATTTSISIANTQVTGLGTMSTQNANNVSITGGSITGTPISGSTVGGTTITASTQFSGPGTGLTGTASGLSIGGNAATATTATTAGSVTNSVTFNNSGTGAVSGTTFNGSAAQTISYNTIGAPSTTGTGASGTWGINISGNAATVTNGVYTTGSYSNPSWITSILGSIVSGAVTSATTATNLAGGLAGSLPYQSGAGATTFLGIGSANYVLTSTGSAPQYVAQSTLSVGSATTATTATNLAGGAASQIPYQTASGTTAFIANGTTGQFLTSNGTSAPSWSSVTTAITITDDTSSATPYYPLFARVTSGTTNTEYTSSTKLNYTPSTGTLSSTIVSGGNHIATASTSASSTTGAFSYGTNNFSDVNVLANFTTNQNQYSQVTVQNTNSGSAASAEFIAYNNNGTASTNFAAVGINSSGYTGTGSINAAGYGYFLTGSTDLVIGTIGSNSLHMVTNSQGTDAITINTSNAIAFNGSYGTSGYILQSNGSGSAPTWVSFSGGATITDDTTTNATRYPLFAAATSGTLSTAYTSSTEYKWNPSTGDLSAYQHVSTNGLSVNSATVNNSYIVASGNNALSVGPVTVASGKSVTVSSGQRWVIL
jgi:hypothetical protein